MRISYTDDEGLVYYLAIVEPAAESGHRVIGVRRKRRVEWLVIAWVLGRISLLASGSSAIVLDVVG